MRLVPLAQLAPQAGHLAAEQLGAAGAQLAGLGDVVKRDQASGAHERSVVLEVATDAVVRVVAVDQEEIELFAVQRPARALERGGRVRVAADQVQALCRSDETAVERDLPYRISAAELA